MDIDKLQEYAKTGGNRSDIIEDIKKQVAKENGFDSWTDVVMELMRGSSTFVPLNMFEEVALRCLNQH